MRQLQTSEMAAQWLRERVTGTIHTDSRKLHAGDGFIAWPGAATDARQYVAAALAGGASACLVESSGAELLNFDGEKVAAYTGLKAASGPIAAAFFAQPSEKLDVLAVTGTNGKTSTAWWLAQALSNLEQVAPVSCSMIGTLGIGVPPAPGSDSNTQVESLLATGLTTPDPVLLQQSFHRFLAHGVKACAIEVSSIGIEEDRLAGTHVRTAILTNFTQDHLDYHGTMEAYWQAKAKLFAWPGLRSAVLNIDDERGAALALSIKGRVSDLWTISCAVPARLQASDIHYDQQGLSFVVVEDGGQECHAVQTRLIGTYNVYNLLGVMAAMRSLGVPLAAIVGICAKLTAVPGRMECVGASGQTLVTVDYAHTPDALGKALAALRSLADQRGGQLWCVFGCGGDRDTVKRPLMGAMASCHADRVVVTSDNPRSEKPEAIISQILLGLTGHAAVNVEPDRAQAIAYAMSLASANDVVLIAGKGHEDYQEVAGVRLPFSDMGQVRRALRTKGESVDQVGTSL